VSFTRQRETKKGKLHNTRSTKHPKKGLGEPRFPPLFFPATLLLSLFLLPVRIPPPRLALLRLLLLLLGLLLLLLGLSLLLGVIRIVGGVVGLLGGLIASRGSLSVARVASVVLLVLLHRIRLFSPN
jgi:hypothetical protein